MQSGEEEKAIAQPVKLMRHTKSASIILHTSLSPLVLCWRELCAWSGSLRQAATRLRLKKGVVNPDSVSYPQDWASSHKILTHLTETGILTNLNIFRKNFVTGSA